MLTNEKRLTDKRNKGPILVGGNQEFKRSYTSPNSTEHARVVMTKEGVSSHKQLCEYCIVLDTQRDDVRKLCKQMYCFQSFMFGHAQQQ